MSDTPVSLSTLLTPSKTVTLDFPGYKGLKIDLCYLRQRRTFKVTKKCVTTKFNKKTHQPQRGAR